MRIDEVQPHTPFELRDYWSSDSPLRHTLARQMAQAGASTETWNELAERLSAFSRATHEEVRPVASLCNRPGAKPRLVQFDEWGRRIDRVETSEGWRRLMEWQNRHGIIGEAYGHEGQDGALAYAKRSSSQSSASAGGRARLGHLARPYNFARTFMLSPESHVNLCPTSMTDGAVRVLELYGTQEQKQRYMPRLLSRDYATSWQAGQWMTEVAGGSDVSMTETIARPLVAKRAGEKSQPGDLYAIYGFKWFSSAIDGHMSLALARTDPDRAKGSRGLSLFLIPLHKHTRRPIPKDADYIDETAPSSNYNGIKVHRLKNKLGTQHVPTAELELCGAVGELIGQEGRGVAQIAQVLNITRIFTANGSVSSIGRGLHIVQSYSERRRVGAAHAGGASTILLRDLAMHNALVAGVAITYRALLQLMWHTTMLLGKNEAGQDSKEQHDHDARRLRLLTPVVKAFGSVRASECEMQLIECMGGQGYMEENQLTTLMRDDLVGRIWEGTPSVLSLDVARVHAQSKGSVLREWINDNRAAMSQAQKTFTSSSLFKEVKSTIKATLAEVEATYLVKRALIPSQQRSASDAVLDDPRLARALLELIGIVECGAQLVQQAVWSASSPAVEHGNADVELHVAHRWVCGSEGRLAAARSQLQRLLQGQAIAQFEKAIAYDEGLALSELTSPDGAATPQEADASPSRGSPRESAQTAPLSARSRL